MLPMEFFDQEDRLSPGESWVEGEGKALGPPEPLPYIVEQTSIVAYESGFFMNNLKG